MLRNKFLPIFISILSIGILHAQEISTDYNSCLHGVRSKSGSWIIEPIYEQLDGVPYGFIASKSGRYGLLDSTGRVLIPFEYDYISGAFYSYYFWDYRMPPYFRVMLNGKYGVADTSNRVIVPPKYETIQGTADTTFIVEEGNEIWSFYNQKGDRFQCPWKTKSPPSRLIPHCYSVGRKPLIGKRKVGIVNDSGRVILPREYYRMSGHETTRTVLIGNKKVYGYCDGAGKLLWPLVLTYPKSNRWYNYYADLTGRLGRGPAHYNGKSGMISVYGDTLLPFIYDEIEAFEDYPVPRETGNLWVVEKNGLKGIYDDVSGWRIPVSCTRIENLETFFADGDSAQVGLMVYSKNNLWGAITTSGQEILPCEYEEMTRSYYGHCVFRKGDKLMLLGTVSYSHMQHLEWKSKITGWEYDEISPAYKSENRVVPASKMFAVFKGTENSTIYYHPGLTHVPLHENTQYSRLIDSGEYFDMVAPDTIVRSGSFYVQELGKPDITNGSVRLYKLNYLQQDSANDGDVDLAYVSSNKEDKISFTDDFHNRAQNEFYITSSEDVIAMNGRLVMSGDSSDYVTYDYHGVNGDIYFVGAEYIGGYTAFDTNGVVKHPVQKTMIGDFSDKYLWLEEKHNSYWTLVESKTGKSVLPKKTVSAGEFPIWDSITIVENEKVGARLYNINKRQYVTNIGFSYLMPLSLKGDLFVVKTCLGRMGILRPDGSWLSDTTWTGMTPLGMCDTIKDPWNPSIDYQTTYYPYYVFSNATNQYFLDVNTKSFTNTDECWNFLWLACRRGTNADLTAFDNLRWTKPINTEQDDDHQPYFLIPEHDTSIFKVWHKKIIVDTLFGSQRVRMDLYVEDESEENDWYEYYDISDENRTNRYCWKCGQKYQNYMWTRDGNIGSFAPFFVNDSVFSFSDVHQYRWAGMEERYNCTNVFLFPQGPRNMLLDSLFDPQKDWRNFIINSVLNYINSHPDVEGDCHNPVALPLLLRDCWQISSRGMMLYPPDFREDYTQVAIWLDWKEIEPYLRDDVKELLK